MVRTPSLTLPPAGNRWRPRYGTGRLLPAPKGGGKITQKLRKQPVSAFSGMRWEEVAGGDARGRLQLAGDGRPWHPSSPRSAILRLGKKRMEPVSFAPGAPVLGDERPKIMRRGDAEPCWGLLPASQPALVAEALLFRESTRAGAASPRHGRVPRGWLPVKPGRAPGCRTGLLSELGELGPELGKAPSGFGSAGLSPRQGVGAWWWHRAGVLPATSPTPLPPSANKMPLTAAEWTPLGCSVPCPRGTRRHPPRPSPGGLPLPGSEAMH